MFCSRCPLKGVLSFVFLAVHLKTAPTAKSVTIIYNWYNSCDHCSRFYRLSAVCGPYSETIVLSYWSNYLHRSLNRTFYTLITVKDFCFLAPARFAIVLFRGLWAGLASLLRARLDERQEGSLQVSAKNRGRRGGNPWYSRALDFASPGQLSTEPPPRPHPPSEPPPRWVWVPDRPDIRDEPQTAGHSGSHSGRERFPRDSREASGVRTTGSRVPVPSRPAAPRSTASSTLSSRWARHNCFEDISTSLRWERHNCLSLRGIKLRLAPSATQLSPVSYERGEKKSLERTPTRNMHVHTT